MFWLKKLLGYWLMPLPFCMALIVAGLLLASCGRFRRRGWAMVAAAALLLLLLSNTWFSVVALRPFESQYPPIPELVAGAPLPKSISDCRYVAVLGSGTSNYPGLSASAELSTSGLARLVEAVRILRALPAARLILSGPGEPGRRSHAATLAAAAVSLGIAPERISLVETALDTEDESRAVAALVGTGKVAVVTSAWHMPRAVLLFKKTGISFVACPADFNCRSENGFGWGLFKVESEALERSTLAVHETLGLIWVRLRGF
jgi:uncharacterized SAM-binding protein YcdF (DUF218 family)